MSAMDFVKALTDNLRSRKVESEISAQAEYRSILEAINRGESIKDYGKVEAILEKLGKKPSDIATDAVILSERFSDRATFDTLPMHKANFAKHEAKINALVEERSAYLTKMAEKIGTAQQALREAESGITIAEAAGRRLVDTCNDATIAAREKELNDERRALRPAYVEAQDELHEANKLAGYHSRVVEGFETTLQRSDDASSITAILDGPAARKVREQLQAAKSKLGPALARQREAKARFDSLQKRLDELNAEGVRLADKKLIP